MVRHGVSRHYQLKKEAEEAINRLFSDTSVDKEKTKEVMQELADDIQFKIESLGDF